MTAFTVRAPDETAEKPDRFAEKMARCRADLATRH